MDIRPAKQTEAAALSELARRAKAYWGYPAAVLDGWSRALSVSARSIRERPTLVAQTGDAIAGFYALAPREASWEIEHIWVDPAFTRRGVGRALLTHALETAARGGARQVRVDADPHAEAFYLACGAVRRGVVPAPIPGEPGRVRPQLTLAVRYGS